MAKHMRASAALPELEAFIDTVCEVSCAIHWYCLALHASCMSLQG